MFADTKMTVKVFAISHQRVLMFWTLAFCTLIFIANASSSEIHGYESNRFYQAMDFLTYFSLITSFSLGFVFHKTRPGAWLNRLPVHRSALILVPFVCLTFISLLIFVFMSKQWELMAGLMNGSPIARFVLMPVVVFEISRHSRRQMSGLLFSVISVVCIWFTSTKMSMVTGGVFTFRSEAFFGIFAVALAAILEQKRLGAILGASVYAASCLSVPLVFSGLYKVNQPLENLVASHNYFPTENTKNGSLIGLSRHRFGQRKIHASPGLGLRGLLSNL